MGGGVRGILTLVALLAAVAFERMASLGARSLYTSQIIAEQSASRFAQILPVVAVLSILGFLIAVGITTIARTARVTIVVGSVLALLAGVLFLVLDSPRAGAFVLAAGNGIVRLCPYAIAGEILGEDSIEPHATSPPPHRVAAVAAFVMAILFVSQGAGAIAGAFFRVSHLDGAAAFQLRYFVVLGLMVSSLLFAIGVLLLALVGRRAAAGGSASVNDPYRAPAPVPDPDPASLPAPTWGHRSLSGLAIVFFPVALFTLANDFGGVAQHVVRERGLAMSALGVLRMVETGMTAFAALLFGIVFLVMAVTRGRTPPLYFLGVGVAGAGLATCIKAVGGSMPVYVVGAVLDGLSSPLGAIGAAYAATALRGQPRSMFVLAIWYAALMQTSMSASPLSSALGSHVPGAIVGLLAIAGAATFLVLMGRVQAAYFSAARSP